ncbi:MAG: Signal transduction histidine-protein kinase/phosphatase DegS [Bacteroidetes bacterium]|jgi:signal transduction histidine kinase|nr:Signal transduction histidine-protein kinase/phosphatase DegS [Bacteroidota bacterium]
MNLRSVLFIVMCLSFRGFSQACDTLTIKKLVGQADLELSKDVDRSYQLAFKAYSLSRECPNTTYFFESVLSLSNAYYQKDQGDSTIKLITPILAKLPAGTSTFYKARLNHMLGSAYTMIMQLENGLKHSLEALRNYEAIKDSSHTSNMFVNIANIYNQQHNFKQAEKYLTKAIQIASKLNRKTALGNVYNTMGILYAENGMLDSAERFFLLSTQIRENLKDYTTLAWNYNNLGGVYTLLDKPSEGIIYFEKALKLFEENKNYDGQTSVANNIGELHLKMGNTQKALNYFNYSRGLYSQTNNPDNLENLYGNLSDYYSYTGDFKTAKQYSDSLIFLKDSLSGERLDRSMAEMQIRFDVEKKDLEIAKNKAELKAKEKQEFIKNIITVAVFALLILLFVIGFLMYRKKQLEHRAKLDAEIATQKETRTKSILDAEEKERRRIAQDLHDGVGQLLSAAKLNLSNLESKLSDQNEDQKLAMQNALTLVDDSVKEVRAVSHNMMPNTLIKLGLGSAVREFITKLGNAPTLKVDLEIVGLDNRLDNQVETVLYRVIQEIINNIIKHANASHISMQLIRHDTELNVMIEDNGVGFETNNLDIYDGIGLKGIITRIEFLNGSVHFDSSVGRGTTVIIDVPLV